MCINVLKLEERFEIINYLKLNFKTIPSKIGPSVYERTGPLHYNKSGL